MFTYATTRKQHCGRNDAATGRPLPHRPTFPFPVSVLGPHRISTRYTYLLEFPATPRKDSSESIPTRYKTAGSIVARACPDLRRASGPRPYVKHPSQKFTADSDTGHQNEPVAHAKTSLSNRDCKLLETPITPTKQSPPPSPNRDKIEGSSRISPVTLTRLTESPPPA